jgi:hypothetical protein
MGTARRPRAICCGRDRARKSAGRRRRRWWGRNSLRFVQKWVGEARGGRDILPRFIAPVRPGSGREQTCHLRSRQEPTALRPGKPAPELWSAYTPRSWQSLRRPLQDLRISWQHNACPVPSSCGWSARLLIAEQAWSLASIWLRRIRTRRGSQARPRFRQSQGRSARKHKHGPATPKPSPALRHHDAKRRASIQSSMRSERRSRLWPSPLLAASTTHLNTR